MIEMNRVTRILHKANFFVRQRRAVNFFHKFVITDIDMLKKKDDISDMKEQFDDKTTNDIGKILDGFDPVKYEVDRRILFEATRLRLYHDEFRGEDSSDQEFEEKLT